MGILDSIRRNMPGSPISIANSILRSYNLCLRSNPSASKEEARRYAIENRYRIIKILSCDEIEEYLKEGCDLGMLVYMCIKKENPVAFKHPFARETLNDLCGFFVKNAPEEASVLMELKKTVDKRIREELGLMF